MIGIYAEYSGAFLRTLSVLTAIPFSIPILVAPLAWARVFRWEVEAGSNLALYFGRCLGAFALTMSGAAWYVAQHAGLQRFFFAMLIFIFAMMIVIHVLGAIQDAQPWTETAEIALWAALLSASLLFYPAA